MAKQYKSALAPLLEQYLEWRRSIGFFSRSQRSLLHSLDEYAAVRRADTDDLTPLFFLEFRRSLGTSASTRNMKMSASRSFCGFLVRRRILRRNPVEDIPFEKENAFAPMVFSRRRTEELLRSVEKAIRKEEKYFFRDLSAYTAILLMARCGLRISEPLRLLPVNYGRNEGSLYIERTKFHKDRLIPLPETCLAHMENYLGARRAFVGKSKRLKLLSRGDGRALSPEDVYRPFRMAVKAIGALRPKSEVADTTFGAPTPHSLRHSFAINTLKSIRERGGSAREMLPVLSVYMGHRKYRYTAVYLKFLDAEQRSNLVDFSVRRQEEI